jgi:hypothetical protein
VREGIKLLGSGNQLQTSLERLGVVRGDGVFSYPVNVEGWRLCALGREEIRDDSGFLGNDVGKLEKAVGRCHLDCHWGQ